MAVFLPQAQFRVPQNAMLNLQPLNDALDTNRRNAMLDRQFTAEQEHRQSQLGMQREQLSMRRQEFDQNQQHAIRQRFGALAQMVENERDPAKRQQMWVNVLRMHPGAGSLDPSFRDPMQGPRLLMAEAGIVQDPLEQQKTQAQLGLIGAQTDQARAHADLYRRQSMQPTQADAKAAEKAALREKLRTDISGGIDQLARLPAEYGGDAGVFGSSVGTFRGSEDLSFGLGPLGRLWGSFTSLAQNTEGSPTEVRAKLAGDTEALAAAIKPLIRAPGEGPWTDKDQERLVAVVGNLATANNVEEYKRRLEGVRERVMANFGIDLPPINWQGSGGVRSPSSGANNVRDMSDDELLSILGGQ